MLERARAAARRADVGLLALLGALTVLCVILPIVIMEMRSLHEQVYRNYATSKAYAYAQERFEIECKQITILKDLRDCFEQTIDSAREPQRAEEDLYAQKQMANWAAGMTYVTWFIGIVTITVAGVSVYYLVEANTLNRTALVMSHRAWVELTEFRLTVPLTWGDAPPNEPIEGRVGVEAMLANVGKTPAFNIWVEVDAAAGFFAPDAGEKRYKTMAQKAIDNPVPAGWGVTAFPDKVARQEHIVAVSKDTAVYSDGLTTKESPISTLLVVVCITYQLIFHNERHQTGLAVSFFSPDAQGLARPIGPERRQIDVAELQISSMYGVKIFAD